MTDGFYDPPDDEIEHCANCEQREEAHGPCTGGCDAMHCPTGTGTFSPAEPDYDRMRDAREDR